VLGSFSSSNIRLVRWASLFICKNKGIGARIIPKFGETAEEQNLWILKIFCITDRISIQARRTGAWEEEMTARL
jgi:hypothetical protein